jgi:hypothetical protein
MSEKDLRGITVNGNDLLGCLAKKESNEYFEEEGKGKKLYHKARVTYKSKAERRGKVRIWTPKEITMYLDEQLKECKTAAEMILLLLKTEDEISARSAIELLKDHPKKPGARGLALALQQIYKKMPDILRKRFIVREAFYSFVREEYRDIDLKNLFSYYRGKLTWDEIKPTLRPDVFKEGKADPVQALMILSRKIQDLEGCNAGIEERLHKMENEIPSKLEESNERLDTIHKMLDFMLKKKMVSSQRMDVHFYFHFGKED